MARPLPPASARRIAPAGPPTVKLPSAPPPQDAPAVDAEPLLRAARAIAEVLPAAVVEDLAPVRDRVDFAAMWRATRAQAVRMGDVGLVGTAGALLYAADHGADLVSARITLGTVSWAGWVDPASGALIALARPANRYLA